MYKRYVLIVLLLILFILWLTAYLPYQFQNPIWQKTLYLDSLLSDYLRAQQPWNSVSRISQGITLFRKPSNSRLYEL